VVNVELPAFQSYRPDERALRSLDVPVHVLVGRDQQFPFFAEAANWVAERVGTSVVHSPGAHGPHLSHPAELAAMISRYALTS